MPKLNAELISRIAHDLKSPLSSVEDALSLLAAAKPGELTSVQQKLVQLCLRNTVQVASRIARLAEWLRLDSGLMDLERQTCDLVAVTDSALEKSRRHRGGVRIEWERPPSPLEMACDSARIEQMIFELLENATVFSDGETPIVVRLSPDPPAAPTPVADRCVRLSVENRCASTPNLRAEDVGEPFYPLRKGRSDAAQGLGVGLPIVRAIARAHNGELVYRRRGDKGVEFAVRLCASRV